MRKCVRLRQASSSLTTFSSEGAAGGPEAQGDVPSAPPLMKIDSRDLIIAAPYTSDDLIIDSVVIKNQMRG